MVFNSLYSQKFLQVKNTDFDFSRGGFEKDSPSYLPKNQRRIKLKDDFTTLLIFVNKD